MRRRMRTARWTWDLTVPIGWLRISAISGWLRPSMNRSVAAARRCIGSCSSARSTSAISVFCSTIVSGCGGPSLRLAQDRVGVGERVERDVGRPLAAQTVPRHVQRDRIEPRLKTQVGSLLRRHLAERAIGSHEGVLDDLLGVLAVAGHAEREAVQAALVIVDDPLEVRSTLGAESAGGARPRFARTIADGTYTPVRSGASALIQCPGPPLLGPRFHTRPKNS